MNWKFWHNSKADRLEEGFAELLEGMTGLNERMAGLEEQVGKLGRLQYKSGQESQGKLERLAEGLQTVLRWQTEQEGHAAEARAAEDKLFEMAQPMIRLLDDLDRLVANLEGEAVAEAWHPMLRQWSEQLLEGLRSAGIRELDVMGRSFDPRVAEAVHSLPREQGAGDSDAQRVAYEVVEVVRRGFALADGTLLRKAHVVTIGVGS